MGIFKYINDRVTGWLTEDRPASDFPICDFDRIRYEVRQCDVLLTEGRSRISDVIKYATQSAWSHSALYLGRIHDIEDPAIRSQAMEYFDGSPDTQLLIEGILGKGTVITPLTFYRDDHIRICRPRGLSPQDAQQVISFAIGKLGHDYDVRQILDLARFLLPWSILPRKWRSSLFNDNTQSTRTVCSTMIAEAFSAVHFPILPHIKKHEETGIELFHGNPRLCTPCDFDYSPYFEIIKYPFVGFDEQPAYRKLPWNKEGVVIRGNERPSKDEAADVKAQFD
ncbi:MAG TPA: hypothetical protein VLG38_06255 [Gammaproteobacteria bacterium]|nr:hypothetical protein [Gammaproteobacteria bacterium]